MRKTVLLISLLLSMSLLSAQVYKIGRAHV